MLCLHQIYICISQFKESKIVFKRRNVKIKIYLQWLAWDIVESKIERWFWVFFPSIILNALKLNLNWKLIFELWITILIALTIFFLLREFPFMVFALYDSSFIIISRYQLVFSININLLFNHQILPIELTKTHCLLPLIVSHRRKS